MVFKPFVKGQKVWLEATHLRFIKDNKKLAAKRHGPFSITEVVSPWAYQLKLPDQWRIHPVFHASLLTPYHENETHGPNFLRPPPDIIEGEEEYEVETIIRHQPGHGNRHCKFLVKWKGYPRSEATWEPMTNLANAQQRVQEYISMHKLPTRP